MAKKKTTRKELLKKDDEFISLSTRFFQYVSTHGKQIQYLAVSVMIIIAIVIGISLYFKHLNKKSLAAYNLAYTILVSDSSSYISEDTINKSIEELDSLIKKYGWTKMATLAIPQLAYLKFGQGKYDEAISLYQTYLKKDKSASIYHLMTHFGLAAAYEAKSEHQSAIQHLKKIIDDENNFLKEEAMFSLGRLYALSGQQEKSKETFKDFVNQFKESPLVPLAKANLAK
ncbi:MAG TPA: tetratricopeptide repeat protein [Desulfatiglandales bacterium]|nr:tetratricopeptide repeat protein [Desulfatiglandales bacterium]